jgi:ribosome-binding protein aMBF1 (putative translation factor)
MAAVKRKIRIKPYYDAKPFFDKMLEDPEMRILFEEARAKSQIAQTVYNARKHAHLTQSELAEKVGMHQSAIARLESSQNDRIATMPILTKIAKACGGVFEIGIRFDQRKTANR